MSNILSTAATNAAFLAIPSDNGKLVATIVQGSGFKQLDQHPELKCPGIYIAVSPVGEVYVGVAGNLLARTNRFTATPTPPGMLVFIAGNTAPLTQESAPNGLSQRRHASGHDRCVVYYRQSQAGKGSKGTCVFRRLSSALVVCGFE